MRSLVPAFMVIALALLLVGGAGAQKFVELAFNGTNPTAAHTDRPPGASPLSVRVTL
jgi:hypothetical protein